MDDEVVGVDVDGLIPNNKLLIRSTICIDIPNDLHTYIANIQLVCPHRQEIILLRILLLKPNQVKADFPLSHVAQEVELTVVFIEYCILNQINLILFI